jgi:LPS export ABC transporter protein LptC
VKILGLKFSLQIIPVLLAFGIVCSCGDLPEKQVQELEKEVYPISIGTNVELIYSEKAEVKIKIEAPLMEEYGEDEGKYMEMTEGIKVVFYDSLRNIVSTLTSDYAIHKVSKNIMEAKKNVVVINDKGEVLNTESLIWYEDSAKIFSDEFVEISTADEIIRGEGMVANQDFTDWRIFKTTGEINVKEEGVKNDKE